MLCVRYIDTGKSGTKHALREIYGEQKGEMDMDQMDRCWMWLCSCPGLYRQTITALLRVFGTPKKIYEAPVRALLPWRELSTPETMAWVNSLTAYKEQVTLAMAERLLQEKGIRFVGRYEESFPKRLKHLVDCPYGIFYRGHLPDEERPAAAVIGARRCSNYGQQMAALIAGELTLAGYQVISGMAAGIDGTAQTACKDAGGSSFAVLGSGADVCYPREHRRLFEELPKKGGVLSEYPPGTQPLKLHFPSRNRLISGLADAVIVVEARKQSGSLITADIALDQGKEVFAVPGRYNDELSYGCNALIEQGAGIILSPENLLQNLAVSLNLQHRGEEKIVSDTAAGRMMRQTAEMKEEERRVYQVLGMEAKGIDEIAREAGCTMLQTMTALINLQMKHFAEEISKNRFALRLIS